MNANRVIVCIRDGSCGKGGIHCRCCNRNAKRVARKSFAGYVRSRVNTFFRRDLLRSPS